MRSLFSSGFRGMKEMSRKLDWLPAAHTEGERIAYRRGWEAGKRFGRTQAVDEIIRRISKQIAKNKRDRKTGMVLA